MQRIKTSRERGCKNCIYSWEAQSKDVYCDYWDIEKHSRPKDNGPGKCKMFKPISGNKNKREWSYYLDYEHK